jgi:hypothetical protein
MLPETDPQYTKRRRTPLLRCKFAMLTALDALDPVRLATHRLRQKPAHR